METTHNDRSDESDAIQTFVNTEFGNIRMLNDTLTGKILFCGKDVATALGYSNPREAVREKTNGGVKRSLIDTLGREQEAIFIPEGDVYRLIVRSNLPTAEKFERWVFDEVLPTIRETGGYILSSPDSGAQAAPDSDVDKSHTILSRVLRRLVSVKTLAAMSR